MTDNTVDLNHVQLVVNAFSFVTEDTQESLGDQKLDDGAQTSVTHLPSRKFHGIWDGLVYEDQLQFKLLHFLCRMRRLTDFLSLYYSAVLSNSVALSSRGESTCVIPWNKIVLLWGPPGTGKTSLCKALAQKIAIRLGSKFARAKLVEINALSIFSKFYGESGRIVGNLFRDVESQLEKEPDVFVLLLIDEIESLVSARERNLSGNEPRDTMRVVNGFLMALDRLQKYSNVLIFCTSNLMHAMVDYLKPSALAHTRAYSTIGPRLP